VGLVIILRKLISLIRPIVVFVVFFLVPVILLFLLVIVGIPLFGLLRRPARPARRDFRGI
jgi:hypothetical protein